MYIYIAHQQKISNALCTLILVCKQECFKLATLTVNR